MEDFELQNPAPGWKKHLFLLARLTVSFGLIAYIVHSIVSRSDISTIPAYYSHAHYGWLLAAVASIVFLLSLGALRWGILLRAQGIRLSAGSILMYFLIGMFFNNFLPSTVGGDAIKVFYLHRLGNKGREGFVSILLDRLIGIAGLCLVADVALLIGWRNLMANQALRERAPLIFGVVGGLTVALVCFFIIVFNARVMRCFFRIIPRRLARVEVKIREIHDCILLYRGKRGMLLGALAVSLFVWILIVLSSWMIYRGFHSSGAGPADPAIAGISLGYFYLFIPTISAIMSIPISFGGLGTREAFFILFFSSLDGISELDALIISLNYYFAFLFASGLGGIIYILKDQLRFHRELT